MPSGWTGSLRLEKPATGELLNIWGDHVDVVIDHVDYAIAGWLNKTITGDYPLTTANAGDDEARAAMIKFSGALAANAAITLPTVSKSYFVFNNTNKVLTFTTGSGSTVSIDAGDKTVIYCDGAGVHTTTFGSLGLKDFIAASVLGATGALPATTGQDNKILMCQSGSWAPYVWTANATDIFAGSASLKAVTPAAELAAVTPVAVAYAATITPDLLNGRNFIFGALTGNLTLANPTASSMAASLGQFIAFTIPQDGSGARTWSVGTYYKFPGGTPALSTAASATDLVVGYVESLTVIRCSLTKAYG
jgi:hypothetical protein